MIYLITGSPGAGKSLYAVSQAIKRILGGLPGEVEGRRLVVGGIPDLLLDHEICDVPKFDPEARAADPADRFPTDTPLEVPYSADTWWQWCQPGDLIVIDECQRLFRPMASGRRVPMHISKLETHRHYGVDLLLITQHPNLVHSNVRSLIGSHEDVRRLWGTHQTMVYSWDHCSNPNRTAVAQKRMVRHDKAAFKLYKSAELHNKPKLRIPALVLLFPLIVLMAGLLIAYAVSGVSGLMGPNSPASSPAPPSSAAGESKAAPRQPLGASDTSDKVLADDRQAIACVSHRFVCRCASSSAVWAVPAAHHVCNAPGPTWFLDKPAQDWLILDGVKHYGRSADLVARDALALGMAP